MMIKLLIPLLSGLFCLACTTAQAQEIETYDPTWNESAFTHVGFGLTFGILFENVLDVRFSDSGKQPQNTFFYLGFEGIAGHSYGQTCDPWGTAHFVGVTGGFDYTFGRGAFTIYSEASYNYLANMFTPGVALGLLYEFTGPDPGIGIQATQSVMGITLRQRYDGHLTSGLGMSIPFGRAPIFSFKSNCIRYVEG